MSTTALNLSNLELVSTLRVAPLNGPPISEDYNDGEQEKLVDLTTLATFVNNTLLPMLNTLNIAAASGILGSNIYGDSTSQETLFYNSLTGTSLSIADSLRLLFGQLQTIQTIEGNLSVQVAALQARLSASNQNDIALALQGFVSSLNLQEGQLKALQNAISNIQLLVGSSINAQVLTPVIAASATEAIAVLWQLPFADNTYIVSYGIEDASGFLQVMGFTYLPGGAGVLIRVYNSDISAAHQGTVQAIGRTSTVSLS